MPPLNQEQLEQTLIALFGWADFRCSSMPRLNSYYCHETVPGITFTEGSMTKQSFKEEADINNIVNRYHKTGVLPSGSRQPEYGDYSSGDDFNSSLIKIQEAQDDFNNLPSHIRNKFNNDPAELINFLHNEDNYEEARTLGLLQDGLPSVGGQGAQPPTPSPTTTNTEPISAAPPPTDPQV